MTDNPSSTSIRLPDALGTDVVQRTQYGMRYPDGKVVWDEVDYLAGLTNRRKIKIEHLAVSTGTHARFTEQQDWKRYLERVAGEVNIDPAPYVEGHRIITRTVVVSVTEATYQDGSALPVPEPEPVAAPPAPQAPWV